MPAFVAIPYRAALITPFKGTLSGCLSPQPDIGYHCIYHKSDTGVNLSYKFSLTFLDDKL